MYRLQQALLTKCIPTYFSLSGMATVSVSSPDSANSLAVAASLAIAAATFLLVQMVSTLKQNLVNVSLLTKQRRDEVELMIITMLVRPEHAQLMLLLSHCTHQSWEAS
jgi:hypothetical protein